MSLILLPVLPLLHKAEAQDLLSLQSARQLAMHRNNLGKLASSQIVKKQALEVRWELAETEAELKGALIKRFLTLEELDRLAGLKKTEGCLPQ